MNYSGSFILAVCLCSVLAVAYHCPNKSTIRVTCDRSEVKEYKRIGAKYYFIGDIRMSWFSAAHFCRKFGGDLALIESTAEMDAISAHLIANGFRENSFWISGNDLGEDFRFVSIANGLPLNFTSWSGGQPDNRGVEHCLHLWVRDGAFRMNNWLCREHARFLCQRENYTRCWEGC